MNALTSSPSTVGVLVGVVVRMSFEVISDELGRFDDYEVYTCPTCGWKTTLHGVGGDVAECPECLANEAEADAEADEQLRLEKLWEEQEEEEGDH